MSSKPVDSALSNPAVSRCWEAGEVACNASLAEGHSMESAQRSGSTAYRRAMPPLKGVRNTRNFIACVTYGALIGVIPGPEASRLLYAAQIAYSTRRTRKRQEKPTPASTEKSHSGAIQIGLCANQEPPSSPAQDAQILPEQPVTPLAAQFSASPLPPLQETSAPHRPASVSQ